MPAAAPDEVVAALTAREPIFHRAGFGTTRSDFEAMTAPSYFEVGASGRVYDRGFVLDTLARRHASPHADPWAVDDFAVLHAGGDTWLATYRLAQGTRITRRATLWRRDGGSWVALYHQGTIAADGG